MGKFYSDQLERGVQLLYFQTDPAKYAEGKALLKRAVEQKEKDAYYFMARCFAWGDGNTEKNMYMAREYSRTGIEKGSDLCVLGAERFQGLNGEVAAAMTRSLADSLEAVKRVAEQGEPMAQYAVGLFYFWQDMQALQKPKDKADFERYQAQNGKESLKWFRRAADQGCVLAFRNVFAGMWDGINGVKKDRKGTVAYVEEKWGSVDMPYTVIWEVARYYREQKNGQKAVIWYERGIEKGDGACSNDLGTLYLNGEAGIPADEKRAFALFQQGVQRNSEYSLYNLGRCYLNGWNVCRSEKEALHYFRKAAERGHAGAQRYLAGFYYEGKLVGRDCAQSFFWANRAEAQGNTAAKLILGKCYLFGDGTEKDEELALKYFEECADLYPEACWYLGQMYENGYGGKIDEEKAGAFYEKAAEGGYHDAKEKLKRFKKTFTGKWKRKK